jgi:hypothetical protein
MQHHSAARLTSVVKPLIARYSDLGKALELEVAPGISARWPSNTTNTRKNEGNADYGDDGPRPPGACRVTCGPNDFDFENIAGKTVASVRKALATIFSIRGDADPYVRAAVVAPGYRLRPGDQLEFLCRYGLKAAANFLGTDFGQRERDDFYVTPAHATWSLLRREQFGGTIWEPACGDGAISRVLQAAGYEVLSTDLIDRGYGAVLDFLTSHQVVKNIVSNPPYKLAEAFVRKALESTTYKVAMLLKLTFLESQSRYRLFQETPPKRVYVFSKRLSLYRGGVENRGGGTTAFAWFVWEHGHVKETTLQVIPPGG